MSKSERQYGTAGRNKSTWVARFEDLLLKYDGKIPEKGLEAFAGRIIGERVEKVKNDIRAIGSPIFGSAEFRGKSYRLPSATNNLCNWIESQVKSSLDSLLDDLRAGKKVQAKSSIIAPF